MLKSYRVISTFCRICIFFTVIIKLSVFNLCAENFTDKGINHYNKSIDLSALNPSVSKFIHEIAETENINKSNLIKLFSQVKYNTDVIRLIEKPAEKRLLWSQYKQLFMKKENIKNGVQFWMKHHAALSKAEKEYGVSPVVIMGILGVETRFGRLTGNYKVIDALTTLSFAYPPREKFFKSELKQFLILSYKKKFDPLKLTGSYAGAMGMAQFMPSSYMAFAVDFNNSGHSDIWNSPADAIGSIANYLKKHGWKRELEIASPVNIKGTEYKKLLSNSSLPNISFSKAKSLGIENTWPMLPETSIRLLALDIDDGQEFWITTKNFYAITRYNRSDLYAMAVFLLGRNIQKEYHDTVNHIKKPI